MTFDEQQVLSRFHRALVRELQAKNPEHLSSPFTVAEIYQNLVPYRSHRDEIGVEMNADYEHALLRLLAGEGDYLTIESRTARQEIRDELDSPNPNTTLYREFAAADVRLNPEKLDEGLLEEISEELAMAAVMGEEELEVEHMDEGGLEEGYGSEEGSEGRFEKLEVEPIGASLARPHEEEEGSEELASEEVPVELSDESESPEGEDRAPGPEEEEEEEGELPPFENCPWCREALPQEARVRYCPFCGSNVRRVPCPSCGEELQLNWRFCIACGTEVTS